MPSREVDRRSVREDTRRTKSWKLIQSQGQMAVAAVGGSSITNHAALWNLDYASAGHTGFMSLGTDQIATGAKQWTAAATKTPIRLTAAASQSVPIFRIDAGLTYDLLQVDEVGYLGLGDDPDARFTIRARDVTETDIMTLPGGKPWAWYQADDWNGDGVAEVTADDTRIDTWGDKANYPSAARSLTNTTPANAMYYRKNLSHTRVPSALPGGISGGAYISGFLHLGATPSQYYNRLVTGVGDGSSSEFSAWTVFMVAASPATGSSVPQFAFGTPYKSPEGYYYSRLGMASSLYDDAFISLRGKGVPPPTNEERYTWPGGSAPSKPYPDRTRFCVHLMTHLAGSGTALYTVNGELFTTQLVTSNYSASWWYQYFNAYDVGGGISFVSQFYAEVIVFDRVLSAADLAAVNAYLYRRYGIAASSGAREPFIRLKSQDGTVRLTYTEGYRLGLNVGASPTALVDLAPAQTDEVVIQITAKVGQIGNLQNWRSSAGVTRSFVDKDAYLNAWDGGHIEKLPGLHPFLLAGV